MADKETALEALKTLLETILISNGYTLDIKKVTRQFETADEMSVSDAPFFLIQDNEPEIITPTTGSCATIEVEVLVVGYVNNKDSVSTKMNELDSALAKAIYSDVTLGGAVALASIRPIKGRDGEAFEPFGVFMRPINLTYEVNLINGL